MNLPILMYHKLQTAPSHDDLAVCADAFQAQVKWLKKNGYQTLDLAYMAGILQTQRTLPRKPVVITFDDAYQSVLDLGRPILEAAGFTATVFTVSEQLGTTNYWDQGKPVEQAACLSGKALCDLAGAGWEIGAHGATHANLTTVSGEDLVRETTGARETLSALIKHPVLTFAYPYGAWNPVAREAVRQAGYLAGCAISPGTPSVTTDLLALRRVYVKPSDSLNAFKRKISSWYLAYRAWRKR